MRDQKDARGTLIRGALHRVAGRPAEVGDVNDGDGIIGADKESLSGRHLSERRLYLQDRNGAPVSGRVKNDVA